MLVRGETRVKGNFRDGSKVFASRRVTERALRNVSLCHAWMARGMLKVEGAGLQNRTRNVSNL